MYRLLTILSLFVVIIAASGKILAQEPLEVKQQFGKRAAMIPQSPADTGILFDEGRMEKARREYIYDLRTSGGEKSIRKIEMDAYNAIRKMENTAAFKVQSSSAWQPIGGSQDGHSSGRVRAIAFDPTNSKVVYIGAASGGLWKTMDIDAKPIQWINLSDRLPTVNFGALAVDPKRPNIVFAGTGESQGDNYLEPIGSGLFKSIDGGLNWDTVATTAVAGNVCSQIVIDPLNTDLIYVATDNGSGIIKSSDGGTSWKKIPVGVSPLTIAIDPVTPSNLYVSGFSKIYRSPDYGETWTQTKAGLPTSSLGRITIAVAPSAPQTIYASIGNSSTRGFLGLWVSDDFGMNWRKINTGTTNLIGNQQEWCNALVVHPTSAKRIFIGGLDIFQSNDSGKNANYASHWTDQVTLPSYVHADIHQLIFNGTSSSSPLYACTDGGIAKATSPFTSSWNTEINKGLATLQFVGVDANKSFSYVTGGCQDNGTNRAYVGSPEFHETHRGDGGRAWVSPDDSLIAYTTYVYTSFYNSNDAANEFGTNLITAQNNPELFNDGMGNGNGEGAPFYPAYDVSSDGDVVAFGGNSHVWISLHRGSDGFTTVKPPTVAINRATAIHISQNDATLMWAGTGTSVFRSTDQGFTWVKTTITGGGAVLGITSNPKNPLEVFAATSGGKHFYKSSDGGATFSSPATNLPLASYCIAFNSKDGKFFLGTEKGVVWSQDGGATWYPLMNGFPLVLVTTLRIKGENDNILLAGTYGRGMFWLDLSTVGVKSEANSNVSLSLDPVYPNPLTSENAKVGFTMKEGGLATITIHDLLGRELRILEKSYFDAGHHESSFAPVGLSKGTYFVMLTANGRSVSEKVTLN